MQREPTAPERLDTARRLHLMKSFLRSRDAASKGAALMIVLALVVLVTGLALAYFTRTTTDRQLAQSSYNDTSADMLARSALDIVVGDFKQEIINDPRVATRNDIQPQRYGDAVDSELNQAQLHRRSDRRTSSCQLECRFCKRALDQHNALEQPLLDPEGNPSDTSINPSPTPTFIAPDWVLITAQGPTAQSDTVTVIGRYAFTVYDEGGLLDMSVAGHPRSSDSTIGAGLACPAAVTGPDALVSQCWA